MVSEVGKAVAGDKLDAVLNVAGGWAGGNASSAEFIKVKEDGFITQNSKLFCLQFLFAISILARFLFYF